MFAFVDIPLLLVATRQDQKLYQMCLCHPSRHSHRSYDPQRLSWWWELLSAVDLFFSLFSGADIPVCLLSSHNMYRSLPVLPLKKLPPARKLTAVDWSIKNAKNRKLFYLPIYHKIFTLNWNLSIIGIRNEEKQGFMLEEVAICSK